MEKNTTAVFSRTDTTDNQSEDPRLHRHFLSFLCNIPLLPWLPKGRGIAGIFLSTKLHRGEIFWFKIPADSPAPTKVFSLLTTRLYLAGNQKPRTTTALDTTSSSQMLSNFFKSAALTLISSSILV